MDPTGSLITIESAFSDDGVLTDYNIFSVISQHAESAAVLVLPAIQYYTGQLLDVAGITAFAHKHGLMVVWDLAHAVGNVPLSLHDWDVDAAVWCNYKYLNSGPGAIGGLFVHSRQTTGADAAENLLPGRLAGWWGNDKATRFEMATAPGFRPVAGAAGFQLSNPSVADITALCASLEVFREAGGMGPLRERSVRLTAYLAGLLAGVSERSGGKCRVITPAEPGSRGAQLSIRLASGLLGAVMEGLRERAIVVDERKPDVIRVAPAPLYNSFVDCATFAHAIEQVLAGTGSG